MNCTITPSKLRGSVFAPPSKSIAHRQLICAALSDRPSLLELSGISDDIQATIDCLKALGADIERSNGKLFIEPISTPADNAVLNCGESGSTLRFLLPVAAALTKSCTFTGSPRLAARPINELVYAMARNGASFSSENLPLTVSGGLEAGLYELSGGISSQFTSGLLLALPLLEGESEITISGSLSSAPYVDMTLSVLDAYGVKVKKTQKGFKICEKQRFLSQNAQKVEGDWSAAAFFLTAGAISGEITVRGLPESTLQGDRIVAEHLKSLGAYVSEENGSVKAERAPFTACDFDLYDTPDLFPILAAAACFAKGESRFSGIAGQRFKESDRVCAVTDMIAALGGNARTEGESIVITGAELSGGEVDCRNDHRIAMAAAVAAARCKGKTKLLGWECVSKSYPGFWSDYAALGGKVNFDV